jgi:hypothetical protein
VLAVVVIWNERRSGNLLFHISWRPDLARIRRLIQLGLPAAGQILFEGAVFAVVTVMVARLDEASLAAHGIAVNVISTTYMVPLGISSAAAVRVGQAYGRRDIHGAAVAGWTALALSALFMGTAGVLLAVVPQWIVRLYIGDAAVIGDGRAPAPYRRCLRAVRRLPGSHRRRAPRPRRHAHSHAGAPGGILGRWHARRLYALLSAGMGRSRNLGRTERCVGPDWRRARRFLAPRYSDRSAAIGSTRVARRAGSQPANSVSTSTAAALNT